MAEPALARGRKLALRIDLGRVAPYLLMAGLAFLILYPLAMLIYGSLSTKLPGEAGNALTLEWFRRAFSSFEVARVLLITIGIAIPRVLIAIVFATAFAWILARTNTPAKGWLEALMVFMFFLPNLPWVMAWILMAGPKVGFLNQFVLAPLPGDIALNVYSYAGIIILGGVRTAPIMYLFIAPAFRAMDASLEESSRMSGASALTTIRRINVPLAMPALTGQAIMAFIAMLSSFEIEYLLGVGGGVWVYSTTIWSYLYRRVPPMVGPAAAMSFLLMFITFGLVILQWRILGSRIYAVVTGRGYRARPYDLGRWRWLTFSFILAFFFFFVLLPFIVLAVNSFAKASGVYGLGGYFTTEWWGGMFGRSTRSALVNTLILGVGAATLGVFLSSMVSYLVTRTKWWLRGPMDLLSWVPFTLPAIVMALGYFWAYMFLPIPIYGTIWLLVLVMATRGIPFSCRVLNSTMVQIGAELEESSRIHGASWTHTFRRIMFPLLRPAFIYSWVLLFVIAVRDLETVIFLVSSRANNVISTMIMTWAGSRAEMAYGLALVQTAICVAGYLIALRFAPKAQVA